MEDKIFKSNGKTFSAYYAACGWLRENGYSCGPTSIDGPAGIVKGDVYISKWRNMSKQEQESLDGCLYSDREGDAVIKWNRPQLSIVRGK